MSQTVLKLKLSLDWTPVWTKNEITPEITPESAYLYYSYSLLVCFVFGYIFVSFFQLCRLPMYVCVADFLSIPQLVYVGTVRVSYFIVYQYALSLNNAEISNDQMATFTKLSVAPKYVFISRFPLNHVHHNSVTICCAFFWLISLFLISKKLNKKTE